MITFGEVQLGLLGALVLVGGIGIGLAIKWLNGRRAAVTDVLNGPVLHGRVRMREDLSGRPVVASLKLTEFGEQQRREEAERNRTAIDHIRATGRCVHCTGTMAGCDCGAAFHCARCAFGVDGPHRETCARLHVPIPQAGFEQFDSRAFAPPFASHTADSEALGVRAVSGGLSALLFALLLACPAPSLAAYGPGAVAPLAHALFAFLILAALNVAGALTLRRFWPARKPSGIAFQWPHDLPAGVDVSAIALAAFDRPESRLERIWRAHANKVGREAIDYLRARRAPAGFRKYMSRAGLGLACLALLACPAPSTAAPTVSLDVGWGHCQGKPGTTFQVQPWGLGFDAADGTGPTLLFAEQTGNTVCAWTIGGASRLLAGTGVRGSSGDGGDATAAQLQSPVDVVADVSEIYITEGDRIRVLQRAGNTITTAVASGTLWGPMGLALDDDDHVFVADCNQHRVVRFNRPCFGPGTCGPAVTVAGQSGMPGNSGDGGPATAARLNCPADVAIAADGSLLIADMSNNRIRRVAADGTISTVAGGGFPPAPNIGDGGPATLARVSFPRAVLGAPDGGFYVADGGLNRVRLVTPAGVISTILGTGELNTNFQRSAAPLLQQLNPPSGLARSPAGALFVSSDRPGAGAIFTLRDGGVAPVTPTAALPTPTVAAPTLTATRTLPPATATATRTSTAVPTATRTIPPTATASATTIPTCQPGQVPECVP